MGNVRCDCIVAGTILGVVGILTSILCGSFSFIFIFNFLYAGAAEFSLGIIAICVLNLMASIVFIWGINKRKIGYLVAALVWWTVPLFVCLLFFAVWAHAKLTHPYDKLHKKDESYTFFNNLFKMIAIDGTVFFLSFYCLAVWCFIKLRVLILKSRWENQRLGISYTAAPTKHAELNFC